MLFLHVQFGLVSVQETELCLTSSVWFGQNGKTLLRLVTSLFGVKRTGITKKNNIMMIFCANIQHNLNELRKTS